MTAGHRLALVATAVLAVPWGAGPVVRPPAAAAATARPGVWIGRGELQQLPERGPAWAALRHEADARLGTPHLNGRNSSEDVSVLAAALVYARTGQRRYAEKAAAGIAAAIGSEQGGRTLALARGLQSYIIAADLIDLDRFDPAAGRTFRSWLTTVRTERLRPADTPTLIATHERRPNNWGTHAGASRIAADVYLGDRADLARAAKVFRGWLGDRRAYHGFAFGDRSWQSDPRAPVGVDPPGTVRSGLPLDGALPDDLRRGCPFQVPPCPTGYPWEALQGAVVQAELLSRQGYDSWNWGHQALLRAVRFLQRLDARFPGSGWRAHGDDTWIPWLINARYHVHLPTVSPTLPGKGMGFTDWTAGGAGAATATPAPLPSPATSGGPGASSSRVGGALLIVVALLVALLAAVAVGRHGLGRRAGRG